jgi:hypothetical protein
VRRLPCLLVLGACGRIAFDPLTSGSGGDGGGGGGDTPDGTLSTAHDEDGDGIVDADDVCPHMVNPGQADTDGDRVGNGCDPRTSTPGDVIVLFATFESDNPFVPSNTMWTISGDALRYAGAGFLTMNYTVTNAPSLVEIGADLGAQVAPVRQISVGLHDGSTNPHGYVEVYDDVNLQYVASSRFDGSTYLMSMFEALGSGMHPGAFTLGYAFIPGAQAAHAIDAGWGSERYMASALATPVTADELEIDVRGIDIAIRYVILIQSN